MSKPKWFISRGAGVYTALIPADELPLSLSLQGIPSTMTVDQVGGMTFVAETGPASQRFMLDRQSPFPGQPLSDIPTPSPSPIAAPLKQFCAPDAQVGGITPHPNNFNTGAEMIPKVEEAQAVIDSICRPESAAAVRVDGYWPPQRHLPPSGNEPDETKKVYCSYWMHHGSCDYTQQGCKYKHEMPTDIHTLRKLGFRGIPKWYLEEQAVKRSRQTGMGGTSIVKSSSAITRPLAKANQALASSALKGKASVPEESNVKRSRFIEDAATVPATRGSVTTRATPRSTDVLKPSSAGKTEPELTPPTRVVSKYASTASSTKAIPLLPPAKPIKDSLNLIDLSDDDEAPTIRPCSPASATSTPPSTSLPSSPLTLTSESSSDPGDATSDPQTPPTGILAVDSPTSEKGIFIPPGESPLSHRERFRTKQHQRFTKRTTHRSSPKVGVTGARTRKMNTSASCANTAASCASRQEPAMSNLGAFQASSGGVLGGGKATGLNASRYAVLGTGIEHSFAPPNVESGKSGK